MSVMSGAWVSRARLQAGDGSADADEADVVVPQRRAAAMAMISSAV